MWGGGGGGSVDLVCFVPVGIGNRDYSGDKEKKLADLIMVGIKVLTITMILI